MYTDKDKKSVRIRFICVYPCAICACLGKNLSSHDYGRMNPTPMEALYNQPHLYLPQHQRRPVRSRVAPGPGVARFDRLGRLALFTRRRPTRAGDRAGDPRGAGLYGRG